MDHQKANIIHGVRAAIQDMRLVPHLVEESSFYLEVKKSLATVNITHHNFYFDRDPGEVLLLGQYLVTKLDLNTLTMGGIFCLPLMSPANTYLLAQPFARGHLDKDGRVFLRPAMPERVLLSLGQLGLAEPGTVGPGLIQYANMEECVRSVGFLHLCRAQVLTPKLPEDDPVCPVPPVKHCPWTAMPAGPDLFLTENIGGKTLVSTNLKSYVSIGPNGRRSPPTAVPSPVALYALEPGQTLLFDNHVVKGTIFANMNPIQMADISFDLTNDEKVAVEEKKVKIVSGKISKAGEKTRKNLELLKDDLDSSWSFGFADLMKSPGSGVTGVCLMGFCLLSSLHYALSLACAARTRRVKAAAKEAVSEELRAAEMEKLRFNLHRRSAEADLPNTQALPFLNPHGYR